ncbi:MAG: NAD-dependent epimerase/dehydratase family protein [Chloroflexota bacterium]
MKIAVTGGNGRIGQAVIKLALAKGHALVNIDQLPQASGQHEKVPYFQISTTDYEAFQNALQDCEALIHLAAYPSPLHQPDHIIHNNNVVSSYNALRAAAEVGIRRVCQASSINAIGGAYSREVSYDYFPVDEAHPTYCEDPYSLSKWICEVQADAIARRYEKMSIASLRIHGVAPKRSDTVAWYERLGEERLAKHLWGYVLSEATAEACLLSLTAEFEGHEVFYIVAPDTMLDKPTLDLIEEHFPDVPRKSELMGNTSLFNCQKAEQILGWQHP